jgi:hypothetical protein
VIAAALDGHRDEVGRMSALTACARRASLDLALFRWSMGNPSLVL